MATRTTPSAPLVILGVDPGTQVTGYGLLLHDRRETRVLDFGAIRLPKTLALPAKCVALFESIESLLERYAPQEVAIETQFVDKNSQTALKLGMMRGLVLLAAGRRGMGLAEYAPSSVKKAVGGGAIGKEQVQKMVQLLLALPSPPEPFDAADALAVALCHAHHLRLSAPLS